jgi:hypothetical protein
MPYSLKILSTLYGNSVGAFLGSYICQYMIWILQDAPVPHEKVD